MEKIQDIIRNYARAKGVDVDINGIKGGFSVKLDEPYGSGFPRFGDFLLDDYADSLKEIKKNIDKYVDDNPVIQGEILARELFGY
jgi:hypothetical protein